MSTSDTIFNALAWQCSRREYCSQDIYKKALQKGLEEKEAAAVLERLVRDGFVDDGRYARAFVRDKAMLAGWGPRKISYALRTKGIPSGTVEAALASIVEDDQDRERAGCRMRDVLSAKWRTVRAGSLQERRAKVLRFALSRGYAYDEVMDFLSTLS